MHSLGPEAVGRARFARFNNPAVATAAVAAATGDAGVVEVHPSGFLGLLDALNSYTHSARLLSIHKLGWGDGTAGEG